MIAVYYWFLIFLFLWVIVGLGNMTSEIRVWILELHFLLGLIILLLKLIGTIILKRFLTFCYLYLLLLRTWLTISLWLQMQILCFIQILCQ